MYFNDNLYFGGFLSDYDDICQLIYIDLFQEAW